MSESHPARGELGRSTSPIPANYDTELQSYKQQALSFFALKESLQNKIVEMDVILKADSLIIPRDVLEEEILERNEKLECEVAKTNENLMCQKRAFQSYQIGKSLTSLLGWGYATKEQATVARVVDNVKQKVTIDLLETNNNLVKSYVEKLKEMESLKSVINAKQKTSLELLQTARQLNRELNPTNQWMQDIGKFLTEDEILKLKKVLDHAMHVHSVLQQVYQDLIICSKVNWKTDSALESFMISANISKP